MYNNIDLSEIPKRVKLYIDDILLRNKKACEDFIKLGCLFAFLGAAFSLVGGFMALMANNNVLDRANTGWRRFFIDPDPWDLIDGLAATVLGVFLLRKSRPAATILFLYSTVTTVLYWKDIVAISKDGIWLRFIPAFIFFNAMRATFIWHKKYRSA